MSFVKVNGDTKQVELPVTPSTDFTKDTPVKFSSGKLVPAADNDTDIVGVIIVGISSSDDDYANDRKEPVLVPTERHVLWEADTADTYSAGSHRGTEVGIADDENVDLDDTTNKVFRVISGDGNKVQGYLKINGAY